jgi:type I restriction enzyme, S subunit
MGFNGHTNPTALPELPRGWARKAIEEICENVTTGGTPSRSNPLFYRGDINWFKTGELKDCYVADSEEIITQEALDNSAAKLFPPETVLMAMYGDGKTITNLGILRNEAVTNQACCAMIADRRLCAPRFLFYALRFHREDFIRLASGGAQRNLSGKLIRRFAINSPPFSEQQAIASVLGVLDDKIELNRQMNETLEALAQTLFKDWFVDAAATKLPKGWTTRALYDCANYINGAAFRNEHFSSNRQGFPVIKIGELKDGIPAQTKFCAVEREPKYRIASGDILFSWSGSPDTSIDTFVWSGGNGWLNQHIFKIQFKRPIDKYFVYHLLRYLKPEFIEIARNKQTTGLGHVTAQDLKRMQTAFPTYEVLEKFNRVAEPLFQKTFSNLCESRTLAELRDALLPKLLSGEVRVSDSKTQQLTDRIKL